MSRTDKTSPDDNNERFKLYQQGFRDVIAQESLIDKDKEELETALQSPKDDHNSKVRDENYRHEQLMSTHREEVSRLNKTIESLYTDESLGETYDSAAQKTKVIYSDIHELRRYGKKLDLENMKKTVSRKKKSGSLPKSDGRSLEEHGEALKLLIKKTLTRVKVSNTIRTIILATVMVTLVGVIVYILSTRK